MIKLATGFILLFSFSASAGLIAGIDVQGHRGARMVRPENTLAGFRYAVEAGVTSLEIDALITKDNKVVVTHDHRLNPETCLDARGARLQSPTRAIREMTLAEIKTYDCATRKNPAWPKQVSVPGERIPTLDELFDMVAKLPGGKDVQFNIETKFNSAEPSLQPDPETFVRLLLEVIANHKVITRTTLESFELRTLKAAHVRMPTLKLSILLGDRPKQNPVEMAKEIGAQILSPAFQWFTKDDVKAAHKAGLQVVAWTANEEKDWKKLVAMGVNGIITDDPKGLIEYLNRQAPATL